MQRCFIVRNSWHLLFQSFPCLIDQFPTQTQAMDSFQQEGESSTYNTENITI